MTILWTWCHAAVHHAHRAFTCSSPFLPTPSPHHPRARRTAVPRPDPLSRTPPSPTTPHKENALTRHDRFPHHPRYTAALVLTAVGTLLAAGMQTGAASAAPGGDRAPAKILATPRAGAAPADLSPAKHAALLKSAGAAVKNTARTLGLGAKEKLVVKDV